MAIQQAGTFQKPLLSFAAETKSPSPDYFCVRFFGERAFAAVKGSTLFDS